MMKKEESLAMNEVIQDGKVVYLKYLLKDSEGEVLDEADEKDPMIYLHGAEQIVPGLEDALEGLKVGDSKQVSVDPEDGYGVHDPKLKMAVDRSQFPEDVIPEEGMQFEVETDDGEDVIFTVTGVQGDKVHVDGNHPLAGEVLHFDVKVVNIREATQEEKDHGHAHDGHHHHDDEHEHDHDHGECGGHHIH